MSSSSGTPGELASSPPDRQTQADAAALAGAIERMAGDLALAEEPGNFAVALETGAPRD